MADNEKIMHFANFNITYGSSEEPMLNHFEDIIFPAFTSGIKRGKTDEYPAFYLDGVYVEEIEDQLVLVGNYIKDMQYDIHTTVQDGKLISSPAEVPTAPYSRFIIFLRNHRMVLVRNETQSPDIRSFQATVRSVLHKYISDTNRERDTNDKLPHALVNIVDIPLSEDIDEILKSVSKINWIRFRFFPLNNDFNPNPIMDNFKELMKTVGSKHANMELRSPDSKGEIKSLLVSSSGLAIPSLQVIDSTGNKTKIEESKFTSNKKIRFGRDITPSDDEYIINQASKDRIISEASVGNNALYMRFIGTIKKHLN